MAEVAIIEERDNTYIREYRCTFLCTFKLSPSNSTLTRLYVIIAIILIEWYEISNLASDRFTDLQKFSHFLSHLDLQLSLLLRTALAIHRNLSVAQVLVLFAVLN